MDNDTKPTINTYVSDMLALEQHLVRPLEHQANDEAVRKFPEASRVITRAYTQATTRIAVLSAHLDAIGGHAGAGIKSGVAATLGAAAAAIGDARKTEVSKYLRDDYSALSLASAAYTMLHTTALALGDEKTAAIAQTGLAEVASTIVQCSASLPVTVLMELRDEGVAVNESVLSRAQADVENAWSQHTAAQTS